MDIKERFYGKLQESREQLDELRRPKDPDKGRKYISGGARAAEDDAAKVYYSKYDDETGKRRKAIKSKSEDDKKAAEKAKGERERAAKRVMKLQKIKEENLEEAKKKKPMTISQKQEQDKSIPSSLASYRDRIYKARTKQLRSK